MDSKEWNVSLRITSPGVYSLVFNGKVSEAAKDAIINAIDERYDNIVKQRDDLIIELEKCQSMKDHPESPDE